ncbi:MAG TPA: hypothetical protein VJR27_00635 [Candidatus Saccharimonadales bacterium]|nr:hypothetical protein [Candidatus Saccharimonadales bacterium]
MSAEVLVSSRDTAEPYKQPEMQAILESPDPSSPYGDTPLFAELMHVTVDIPSPRTSAENLIETDEDADFDARVRQETPIFAESFNPYINIRIKDIATIARQAQDAADLQAARSAVTRRLLADVDYHTRTVPKTPQPVPHPRLLSKSSVWAFKPDYSVHPDELRHLPLPTRLGEDRSAAPPGTLDAPSAMQRIWQKITGIFGKKQTP